MIARGSGGERYSLNKKQRKTYGSYVEYPVMGNGIYKARILQRRRRGRNVEEEVKEAVYNDSYYDDEKPLNVLYLNGKFAGFLYEGYEESKESERQAVREKGYSSNFIVEYDTHEEDKGQYTLRRYFPAGSGIVTIIGQIGVVIVLILVGKNIVYPVQIKALQQIQFSSLVILFSWLNVSGVPAIFAGLATQALLIWKKPELIENPLIGFFTSAAANLAGMVIWTFLTTLLIFLLQEVFNFLLALLPAVILIIVVIYLLKKMFKRY